MKVVRSSNYNETAPDNNFQPTVLHHRLTGLGIYLKIVIASAIVANILLYLYHNL